MFTIPRAANRRHSAFRDRREWIVSAALFAPLVLLSVVAARTWRAEQRYAAVTHRVVHDYARIAAWQYARRANAALHDEAMHAFSGIAPGHQRTTSSDRVEPPTAILARRATSDALFLRHSRTAFTYDFASHRLVAAGDILDGETRALLERRLRQLQHTVRSDDDPHRVLFDSAAGTPQATALWTISTPDGPLRAAYGVVIDSRVLRELLDRTIRQADLLPAANAAARGGSADIAVRLVRQDGGTVFKTAQPLGSTAATDSAALQKGELRTTVDLSPRLANALLIGGAPASQLPSLALMIVVAALLAGIGLVQVRRSRELARLRGNFVANVSHELRTPLAQISMFAETLKLARERSAVEGREFASIILAEARRLTGLVESVLRFSHIESGRAALHLESMSITAEIADAVEAFRPIAESANAVIAVHSGDEMCARLDRAAFRQVVLNLLDNAVKHGGRGTAVDISISRDNGTLKVVVDDSGPGVPRESRAHVFEPFVRLERNNAPGAGIGLSVVRALVAGHGGQVWIEESPRNGARFVVSIPVTPSSSTQSSESTEPK